MSKGAFNKDEFRVKVMKLKTAIYHGTVLSNVSYERREGAQEALNMVLQLLDEYRY